MTFATAANTLAAAVATSAAAAATSTTSTTGALKYHKMVGFGQRLGRRHSHGVRHGSPGRNLGRRGEHLDYRRDQRLGRRDNDLGTAIPVTTLAAEARASVAATTSAAATAATTQPQQLALATTLIDVANATCRHKLGRSHCHDDGLGSPRPSLQVWLPLQPRPMPCRPRQ